MGSERERNTVCVCVSVRIRERERVSEHACAVCGVVRSG